ncbi:3413_t:CDS:10 [Paraglomus occultum]|uniref:3413_t:CDS:1 n=1 Tax=Paraglomus occultum TaxID=144539 RepID=A0A9N9AAR3_9GLOM|nr:3413_t:CDS:10 [Paraglomus occultum]
MANNKKFNRWIGLYVLLIIMLPSALSYNNITYVEDEDMLQVWSFWASYNNGAIVQLLKQVNDTCFEPRIFVRNIDQNGTVFAFTIEYPWPEFNFCRIPNFVPPVEGDVPAQFSVFGNDHIFIPFFRIVDGAYEGRAIIVSGQGEILSSEIWLGPYAKYTETGSLYRTPLLRDVNNDDQFYLRFASGVADRLAWTRVKLSLEPFEVKEIYYGIYDDIIVPGTTSAAFVSVSGDLVAPEISKTNATDDAGFKWAVHVSFLHSDANEPTEPYLIYQTSVQFSQLSVRACASSSDGSGHQCIINMVLNSTFGNSSETFVRVTFLSTGAVVDVKELITINNFAGEMEVYNLPYGGYLLNTLTASVNKTKTFDKLTIDLYDNNGTFIQQADIPTDMHISYGVLTFPNNSVWTVSEIFNKTWNLISTDLPKFLPNDNGYDNPTINATYPKTGETIPTDTKTFSIVYNIPVVSSVGNISIYQATDNGDILREEISGQSEYVSISNNNTVFIQVLDSTFNQPNTNYYVIVGSNFVKSEKFGEALAGINKNVWYFNTGDAEDIYADTVNGLVRLTANGTSYYENLPSGGDKIAFWDSVKRQLSQVIPVDLDRLSIHGKPQYDPSLENKQILFRLQIKSTRATGQRSVSKVMSDLTTLIQHKSITAVQYYTYISMLDETYGFTVTPDLWASFKYEFLAIFCILLFITILYLLARYKYKEGRNFAIFRLAIMLQDLVLDILFLYKNSRDVPNLFLPSILAFAVPVTWNSVIAFCIMVQENATNAKFQIWFSNYPKLASIFTVLAAADVEMLSILSSNFAGFPSFTAPFSVKTKTWMFWGGFTNLFIEDVPQFVIQVFYRNSTISYNIIPFLTLISSSVIITINVIERSYHVVNRLYSRKRCRSTESLESDSNNLIFVSYPTNELLIQPSEKTVVAKSRRRAVSTGDIPTMQKFR